MNKYKELMETNWLIAQGIVEEIPILVRCVSPLGREEIFPELTTLAVVYWEYQGDEQGLPQPEESAPMEEFERRMCTSLAEGDFGAMVGVQTVNGRRAFVYYVRDVEGFQDHLINITDDLEKPYPIQIEVDEDPEWNFFFEHIYLEQGDEERETGED